MKLMLCLFDASNEKGFKGETNFVCLFLCNANSVLRCRFLYIQFTLYWMGHVPLINPFLGFCNIARGTHSSMLR